MTDEHTDGTDRKKGGETDERVDEQIYSRTEGRINERRDTKLIEGRIDYTERYWMQEDLTLKLWAV